MKVLGVGSLLLVGLVASSARAEDPADPFDIDPPYLDVTPRPLLPLAADEGAQLGIGVTVVQRPTRRDIAGSLTLSLPTDGFLAPAPSAPKAKQPMPDDSDEIEGAAPSVEQPYVAPPLLPRIRPRDVRSAVAAALRASRIDEADDELGSLSSRARWSALLPEVRLRATRLLDESTSLSPTEYDPQRTTESGGASLWLEARASWRLDRLAFASEEVRVERLRRQLDDERRSLTREVMHALFAWQRALVHAHDPTATPAACIEAWLDEQQRAAELDVLTDGWHGRWLRQREAIPDPPCVNDTLETGE